MEVNKPLISTFDRYLLVLSLHLWMFQVLKQKMKVMLSWIVLAVSGR